MKTFFPIKIRYENTGIEAIIKGPEFLKNGKPFIVLETNVKVVKKQTRKQKVEKKEVGYKERTYHMFIQPALPPTERHEIERCLEKMGYWVFGGGSFLDMSECDISFSEKVPKIKLIKKHIISTVIE